jgi:anti-sigma28 factor (negative regulator of flagellin synthesis)
MISNINQSGYLHTNDIKRNNQINQSNCSQKTEESKFDQIKKSVEDGTYQLLPTNTLAKIFAESELGI